MDKLFFVELDGKAEYCNEAYVIADNCLEAENKVVKHASNWDEGRIKSRKASKITYLAEIHNCIQGVMYPIFIK